MKFNDQNGCCENDIKAFLELTYRKIFFTCKHWNIESEDIIYIHQLGHNGSVLASHEPFGKIQSREYYKNYK